MSKAYLKAPTILYHGTLARDGRLFSGSEERPIPHPGEGWVETPADLAAEGEIDADAAIAAGQAAKELADQNAALLHEKADAEARAEGAEGELAETKKLLEGEKAAHGETRAQLEEATNDIRRLDSNLQAAKELAATVDGLTEELKLVTGQRDEAQRALAKFDQDGDGKPGGGKGGK